MHLLNDQLKALDVCFTDHLVSPLTHPAFWHLLVGMNWKPLFQDIGKGYTSAIGKSLLLLTLAAAAAAGTWLWHHQWTDIQLLSIRQTSSHLCLALLGAWGWIRFYLAWKEKRAVAAQLVESEKQKKGIDDRLRAAMESKRDTVQPDPFVGWKFDPVHGVWKDKALLGYCPACKTNGKISAMQYNRHWYYCAACNKKYINPNDPPPRPPHSIPPEDFDSPSFA